MLPKFAALYSEDNSFGLGNLFHMAMIRRFGQLASLRREPVENLLWKGIKSYRGRLSILASWNAELQNADRDISDSRSKRRELAIHS